MTYYFEKNTAGNKRSAEKLGLSGFARFSYTGKFVIGQYEVAPQTQLFGFRQPLQAIVKKEK